MLSQVVERMLFLYAKLNPGQGYVQVTSLEDGFVFLSEIHNMYYILCDRV